MKNYIITYTDDGGATFNVESVNAAVAEMRAEVKSTPTWATLAASEKYA